MLASDHITHIFGIKNRLTARCVFVSDVDVDDHLDVISVTLNHCFGSCEC